MSLVYLSAAIGHVICGITDCLMAYTPNGRFNMKDAKDPGKMEEVFRGMPLKRLEVAGVLGVLALTLSAFGFVELSRWMQEYSQAASVVMHISGLFFIVPIVAHHICCSFVEWLYVKQGRTKEVLDDVLLFFRKTMILALIGYMALAVYSVTLGIQIVAGKTNIPAWTAVFTTLPLYLILSPTKLPAKGNIANAGMFFFFFVATIVFN